VHGLGERPDQGHDAVRPAWSGVLLLAMSAVAMAQDTSRCTWSANNQTSVQNGRGQYNTYFGGNVVMRCPEKQLTLRSDSLESYGDEGRVVVIGNVHYTEPRYNVDSDFLTYYQTDERIVASGNVRASMPNGSTMRGPSAEYLRVTPARPVARLNAIGRPTFNIVSKDSTGAEAPPLQVIANTVNMVGDSLVYAGGSVVATREDLQATGDSMALDTQQEVLRMMRQPMIQGRAQRPFTLSGSVIDALSRQRKLQRVVAKGQAKAVSQDMTLTSDTIDLHVTDNLLDRAVAFSRGNNRASAASTSQHIVSDSIDVFMPAQRVREIHAVRSAFAESRPDTMRFKPDTVDWLRGDTIVAFFDTTQARDTVHEVRTERDSARSARDTATPPPRIRQLVARGNAKSFYQLAPADTSMRKPAINYVIGNEIIVDFANQQVSRVTVHQQKGGLYLEPKKVVAAADSTNPGSRPATPRSTPRIPGVPGTSRPVRPPR
jgi:hypothetical protein